MPTHTSHDHLRSPVRRSMLILINNRNNRIKRYELCLEWKLAIVYIRNQHTNWLTLARHPSLLTEGGCHRANTRFLGVTKNPMYSKPRQSNALRDYLQERDHTSQGDRYWGKQLRYKHAPVKQNCCCWAQSPDNPHRLISSAYLAADSTYSKYGAVCKAKQARWANLARPSTDSESLFSWTKALRAAAL